MRIWEDNKITSNKDVAAIIRRAKMWSATDLSAALAGSDPMAAIGSLVAGFWARDMQKELIALLEGVFGTISAGNENKPPAETRLASNLLDISGKTWNRRYHNRYPELLQRSICRTWTSSKYDR